MKCPKCSGVMVLVGAPTETRNVTPTQKSYETYERSVYHCKGCDIWAGIEIPGPTGEPQMLDV